MYGFTNGGEECKGVGETCCKHSWGLRWYILPVQILEREKNGSAEV